MRVDSINLNTFTPSKESIHKKKTISEMLFSEGINKPTFLIQHYNTITDAVFFVAHFF